MLDKDHLGYNKPSLLSFQADWCGSCQTMSPILKQVELELQEHINFIVIDIDKHPQIAAAFQIRSVPSLVLFHQANLVWKQSGIINAKDIIEQITAYL